MTLREAIADAIYSTPGGGGLAFSRHAADSVINTLGLKLEWGKLDENEEGILADTKEKVMDSVGGKLMRRYVSSWKPEDE
jgi:hypothetical protein